MLHGKAPPAALAAIMLCAAPGALAQGGFVGLGIGQSQFDVFGKLGVYRWDIDATVTISGVSGTAGDDGSDPVYGVGGRLNLAGDFGFRAEWERYELDDEEIDVLSVGAELRF